MMNEVDLEILESWLDGELSEEQEHELRQRLAAEPALADELEQLRSERGMRSAMFASLEGDERTGDRVLEHVYAVDAQRGRILRLGRIAALAAACLIVGFLVGYFVHENSAPHIAGNPPSPGAQAHPAAATPIVYTVRITDETGKVINVQKFDSLERAREFSEDLERWQDRLDQMRNGMVTVRSASF